MTPRSKKPVVFSLLFAWGTLFIASFVPVWPGRPILISELSGVTLWNAISDLESWVSKSGFLRGRTPSPEWLADWCWGHGRLAIGILVLGAVVGRLVYWLTWERPRPRVR
jgi:hypothetical protein